MLIFLLFSAYEQMFNRLPVRGFHTSSSLWRDYNSVQEVLGRIKAVASEAIVKQVGAIYLFDVKEQGKYFIDFKNGGGQVGEGDPGTKADVTISMNEDVFLQIFNRKSFTINDDFCVYKMILIYRRTCSRYRLYDRQS